MAQLPRNYWWMDGQSVSTAAMGRRLGLIDAERR